MMTIHGLHYREQFNFEAGGSLPGLELSYHTSPRPYREGDRVVWICHALTANSDPEDWWPGMCGPGKAIDPEKDFVVCVNMLCSPYGSSSPASINPNTGKPYLMTFPITTVRDVVRANIIIRKALGISKIDLLVGSSVGGFQAVEWAVMEPQLIKNAIFIATDARVSAYLTAYNESQRMIFDADPSFAAAASLEGGKAALEACRALSLISYRSYEGYRVTQSDSDPDTLFAARACSYERYQGQKLSRRFDAYCYWYLLKMLDSHNLGRGRGGVESALGSIKAPTSVVAITTDALFPPAILKTMAEAIPGAKYHEISSAFGHDGFLLENEQLTHIINTDFIL